MLGQKVDDVHHALICFGVGSALSGKEKAPQSAVLLEALVQCSQEAQEKRAAPKGGVGVGLALGGVVGAKVVKPHDRENIHDQDVEK